MLKTILLSLPKLQEENGPQRHEGCKEHSASIVKEKAEPRGEASCLVVPEVTVDVTERAHVEGGGVRRDQALRGVYILCIRDTTHISSAMRGTPHTSALLGTRRHQVLVYATSFVM